MMISTSSEGSLVAGDERVIEASGEAPPEHILRILARVRCKTRPTNSSIAEVAIVSQINGVVGTRYHNHLITRM